jgi:CRP-like cAMP-binding protein
LPGVVDVSDLAARVAALRRLPWLADAFDPTLEALAATASEEAIAAGALVIRQGDAPDDFFVTISGRLEVRRHAVDDAAERFVAELAPGSGFGEIGLLEHVPRTASVVAITSGRLLRISGDRFTAAVNAVPASAGGAPGAGLLGRLGAGGAVDGA